jgi:hypothetical protein
MNRLQKFIEQGEYGEKPGRVAYAFEAGLLLAPALQMTCKRCNRLVSRTN